MLAHSEFTTAVRYFRILAALFLCVVGSAIAMIAPVATVYAAANDLSGHATATAVGPHATATLRLPEVFISGAVESSEIAVEFVLQPEWHIYWINPGDSGEEPRFSFAKSEHLEIGAPIFPTPARIPAGPFTNFGFDSASNPVAIRFPVRVATVSENESATADVVVELSYLVCKEECIPAQAVLAGSAPVRKSDSVGKSTLEYESKKYPIVSGPGSRQAPVESTWRILPGSRPLSIALNVVDARDKEFFPLVPDPISSSFTFVAGDGGRPLAPPADSPKADATELAVQLDPAGVVSTEGAVVGLLIDRKSREAKWMRFQKAYHIDWVGLLKTLALAFVGGMLLNLMPCVFPVVSLKVMSFVSEAKGNSRETKLHALLYAAGVLVSLWLLVAVLLALRSAGAAVGWGFQLQSPIFLFVLYAVFLFLGFNLLGVFEINYAGPAFMQNALAARGRMGSFFTGLLTTIVATPCSAPFMGVAIGAALAAGPMESILVFTVLGLGLAVPYVVLGFSPRLVAFLPRPGIWMERLKQGLAFPLFMTAVWLLWVLSQSAESAALIVILAWTVIASFLVWALHYRVPWATGISAVLLVAATAATVRFTDFAGDSEVSELNTGTKVLDWTPYSDLAVDEARAAGKPVFIDFTASWCVTCQINKRLVLDTERGQQMFAAGNVVLFRADWTKRDEEISNALSRLGRNSVPVYAFYGPRSKSDDGSGVRLLPEILTFEILEAALNSAN